MTDQADATARIQDLIYKQEREVIEKLVSSVKDKTACYFFLNLFAPPGYGKTKLLKYVLSAYELTLPSCLISAHDYYNQRTKTFALEGFLLQIVRDVSSLLPARIAKLPPGYDQTIGQNEIGKILYELVERARGFEKPPLLLIDDYDTVPDETRYWLERNVFSNFARVGVATIFSSQQEARFRETLDLRMRIEYRQLQPMNSKDIADALFGYAEIADILYRCTGGLPKPLSNFAQQLETYPVLTRAEFCENVEGWVERYYPTFIEFIQNEVLGEQGGSFQETILALSLLRRFDVRVLGKILPAVLPDLYQGYSTMNYLNLVDSLKSWVQWRLQGGYALAEALRVSLQGYIRFERPDLYQQINLEAENLYRTLLQLEYREAYFIELLYHRLCSFRFREGHGLCSVIDQVILSKIGCELLNDFNGEIADKIGAPELDSLRNSLVRDPDLKFYVEGILCAIEGLIQKHSQADASC